MVRYMSKVIAFATVFACMCFSSCGHVANADVSNSTEMIFFAQKFEGAKTEMEKVHAAIEMINASGISGYSKIEDFEKMFNFSTGYKTESLRRGEYGTYIYHFSPQQESSSDDVAAAFDGWYLVIKYDGGGVVNDYWISNVHK